MDEKTLVFGHRKRDTDSITASISLSYLKNQLGENTEPRALGSLNKETKYALNYFGVEEPDYLNDVKLQLKDINYHKDFILDEKETIYDGYKYMLKEGLTGIPIVKGERDFVGLLTMKDLSRVFLNADDNKIFTSYDNIIKVLNGSKVSKVDEEIKGKLLVGAYETDTFKKNIELDKEIILIVGDRQEIIEHAISSNVQLIVIAGNGNIKESLIKEAENNKVNIIKTPYDTYHTSKLISLSSYLKTMVCSYNPTKFEQTDYVDTILDINNKLRHTNYPVVDKDNKCLGLLRITDLSDKKPKKVILVDHNEKIQSAEGIEEAKVLEIIDHHNIGSVTTDAPINFRNMSVGSTCTILYTLYKEKNVETNNILITRFDIERILLILDKQDSIDRIYINFCNPWPKGKHRKKRLTHTRQLQKYREFLKDEGEIYFKTDDDDLFNSSLIYFKESGFEIISKTYDLHSENIFSKNIETEHEKMFSEQGIKIKALIAKKINIE